MEDGQQSTQVLTSLFTRATPKVEFEFPSLYLKGDCAYFTNF